MRTSWPLGRHVASFYSGIYNQKQRGRPLAVDDAREVLKHLGRLWGFTVRLESVGENGGVDDCLECAA